MANSALTTAVTQYHDSMTLSILLSGEDVIRDEILLNLHEFCLHQSLGLFQRNVNDVSEEVVSEFTITLKNEINEKFTRISADNVKKRIRLEDKTEEFIKEIRKLYSEDILRLLTQEAAPHGELLELQNSKLNNKYIDIFMDKLSAEQRTLDASSFICNKELLCSNLNAEFNDTKTRLGKTQDEIRRDFIENVENIVFEHKTEISEMMIEDYPHNLDKIIIRHKEILQNYLSALDFPIFLTDDEKHENRSEISKRIEKNFSSLLALYKTLNNEADGVIGHCINTYKKNMTEKAVRSGTSRLQLNAYHLEEKTTLENVFTDKTKTFPQNFQSRCKDKYNYRLDEIHSTIIDLFDENVNNLASQSCNNNLSEYNEEMEKHCQANIDPDAFYEWHELYRDRYLDKFDNDFGNVLLNFNTIRKNLEQTLGEAFKNFMACKKQKEALLSQEAEAEADNIMQISEVEYEKHIQKIIFNDECHNETEFIKIVTELKGKALASVKKIDERIHLKFDKRFQFGKRLDLLQLRYFEKFQKKSGKKKMSEFITLLAVHLKESISKINEDQILSSQKLVNHCKQTKRLSSLVINSLSSLDDKEKENFNKIVAEDLDKNYKILEACNEEKLLSITHEHFPKFIEEYKEELRSLEGHVFEKAVLDNYHHSAERRIKKEFKNLAIVNLLSMEKYKELKANLKIQLSTAYKQFQTKMSHLNEQAIEIYNECISEILKYLVEDEFRPINSQESLNSHHDRLKSVTLKLFDGKIKDIRKVNENLRYELECQIDEEFNKYKHKIQKARENTYDEMLSFLNESVQKFIREGESFIEKENSNNWEELVTAKLCDEKNKRTKEFTEVYEKHHVPSDLYNLLKVELQKLLEEAEKIIIDSQKAKIESLNDQIEKIYQDCIAECTGDFEKRCEGHTEQVTLTWVDLCSIVCLTQFKGRMRDINLCPNSRKDQLESEIQNLLREYIQSKSEKVKNAKRHLTQEIQKFKKEIQRFVKNTNCKSEADLKDKIHETEILFLEGKQKHGFPKNLSDQQIKEDLKLAKEAILIEFKENIARLNQKSEEASSQCKIAYRDLIGQATGSISDLEIIRHCHAVILKFVLLQFDLNTANLNVDRNTLKTQLEAEITKEFEQSHASNSSAEYKLMKSVEQASAEVITKFTNDLCSFLKSHCKSEDSLVAKKETLFDLCLKDIVECCKPLENNRDVHREMQKQMKRQLQEIGKKTEETFREESRKIMSFSEMFLNYVEKMKDKFLGNTKEEFLLEFHQLRVQTNLTDFDSGVEEIKINSEAYREELKLKINEHYNQQLSSRLNKQQLEKKEKECIDNYNSEAENALRDSISGGHSEELFLQKLTKLKIQVREAFVRENEAYDEEVLSQNKWKINDKIDKLQVNFIVRFMQQKFTSPFSDNKVYKEKTMKSEDKFSDGNDLHKRMNSFLILYKQRMRVKVDSGAVSTSKQFESLHRTCWEEARQKGSEQNWDEKDMDNRMKGIHECYLHLQSQFKSKFGNEK